MRMAISPPFSQTFFRATSEIASTKFKGFAVSRDIEGTSGLNESSGFAAVHVDDGDSAVGPVSCVRLVAELFSGRTGRVDLHLTA